MVKKFSTKIKFPTKSIAKGNNNNDTSTTSQQQPSAGGSSMADARAEYYASLNTTNGGGLASGGGGGGRGNNNNPFNDSPSRGTNPFGGDNGGGGKSRHMSSSNNNAAKSNPFGDSDSDSDDDDDGGNDALAGFARKKPPPPPPSRPTTASTTSQPTIIAQQNNNNSMRKSTSSNPFGDDDEDDDEVPPQRPNTTGGIIAGSRSSSIQRGASSMNNNPFGDDDDDNVDPPSQPSAASTARGSMRGNMTRGSSVRQASVRGNNTNNNSNTNPFGTDDSTPAASSNNKSLRASTNNPFGDDDDDNNKDEDDPFAKEMKGKNPPQFNNNTREINANPFDDDNNDVPSIPKPLISQQQQHRPPSAPQPRSSIAQQQTSQSQRQSMMKDNNNPFDDGGSSSGGGGGGGPGGSSNAAGLASWLRLNKKEDELGPSTTEPQQQQTSYNSAAVNARANGGSTRQISPDKNTTTTSSDNMNTNYGGQGQQRSNKGMNHKKPKLKKKCRAYITPWPFDNYHTVQEQMYEELASRAASEYDTVMLDDNNNNMNAPSQYNKNNGSHHRGGGTREFDEGSRKTPNKNANGNNNNRRGGGNESKYYERPEELPSIKEAVNDLSLVQFEKKAEERAINIVSTWLFDAGLIDELLVNGAMLGGGSGGMATSHHQQQKSNDAATISSQKTSEGQELGVNGFLVGSEGAELKMDKESSKLRAMIQRDLSIINARLNDGVAASGLEVQELVNAVKSTQDDIGRLRELTTYISDGQISDRDEFLLAKYPYLRKAINARRNLNRCFRELDFFSHIPSTCERLRDDLHGGEWTAEEWSTIRNVSMEHVELEVMLVEAESSMKSGDHNFNEAVVDVFLDSHVQNVWELGDEIRMRIISGIGSAFELSMNNPAGMVALVEAVEVYERAAETFEKKKKKNDNNANNDGGGERLRFTNMRAAALEQLYQDFELRGVEMFRGVHEHAADMAEEEDASNTQFTAVLKAATELVTEIDIVKHQMSPCFAPHWHVEALWSSCVAHVCSNHIVQQIGGPDGQNLPELTITQLLELVAWVEYFRETIEETFPEVSSMRDTKKTYFEERPELFAGDKRTVNMANATESLAWVNNMLWEVHRLAQEEFLVRTRGQTDEWLDKVYGSDPVKNQSAEGKLTTSLCEDVFSFSSVQLRTIRERLSKKSDALILAICIILSHMRSKQVHARNNFLQDLETCCAASNDFTRMSEKCEDMISELISQCEFSEDMVNTVEATSNELMGVYSSDAVYSARSVHIYVFDPIEEEIGIRLFEEDWEETMVDNDLAISLVRTLEDFHEDLEQFMDDFMVVKSVMSLMSATVIFYVKCLLQRAEQHRSNKRPYFGDVKTALDRITGDVKVMRDYFEGLVPQMPSLKKNIEKDFEILATIHELMSVAAGFSVSDAEDFILVLQKRVRDVGITKHIVGDLWHLVAPTEERYVWELVESLEEQLVAIAPVDDALALEVNDRSYVKGLRLDEMAVKLYVKSRRNRPIKATAVESIVKNWKTTWTADDMNNNDVEE